MRRTRLVLLAVLGSCGLSEDSEGSNWVPLPRRTDRVGDRYEVELRSRRDSLAATLRCTDEVLAVEEGRATRVRRTLRGEADAAPAVTEIDVRAGRGSGDGKRTDHFRQFERLLGSAYDVLGGPESSDGALGGPPSIVLDVSDAAWLDSRCTSSFRRVASLDGRRTAEFDVRITFDADTGPPRLDGTMRYDLDDGLLREVHLRGGSDGHQYELHGTQAVVPAGPSR